MNCKTVTPTLKLELLRRKPANTGNTHKPDNACNGQCRSCPNHRPGKR